MIQSVLTDVKFMNHYFCFKYRNLIYNAVRNSTIYALSSGQGKCGVAVIRVSGPQASAAVVTIADLKSLPQPRQAVLRKFKDPVTHDVLDRGLLIWFPGPKSFTGEDSCEFQVHGGPAVISSMLAALGKLNGFQPAEAGEFTRRAFHAGKLDLTAVEGLADLIDAETDAQRKQALLQAEGALSHLYNDWRQTLIKAIGYVEAYIDFSEDENIEADVLDRVNVMVHGLLSDMQKHLASSHCGERLRSGVHTAIVGEPNVGKSTLLNTLCSRPAAIVSSIPGTTRDVLELHLCVGGYPVVVADTAGLRSDPSDVVEKEGISRALLQVQKTDLVIFVIDAVRYSTLKFAHKDLNLPDFLQDRFSHLGIDNIVIDDLVTTSKSATGLQTLNSIKIRQEDNRKNISKNVNSSHNCYTASVHPDKNIIVIFNKIDLLENTQEIASLCKQYSNVVPVSCKMENGIPQFLNKFTQQLENLCGNPARENPMFSQARHRHHVSSCVYCLDTYLAVCAEDIVLAAHHLRKAVRHIASITGHVSTEHVLDVIFRDFCIGK